MLPLLLCNPLKAVLSQWVVASVLVDGDYVERALHQVQIQF